MEKIFASRRSAIYAFKRIVREQKLIIATPNVDAWNGVLTLHRDGNTLVLSSGYYTDYTLTGMLG